MKIIKIIISFCVVFIVSCKKTVVTPTTPVISDIFVQSQNNVSNAGTISFKLINSGTYTLTMMDTLGTNVVTREKFIGKSGINTLSIYTKSIPFTYLYLILADSTNTQIGKTKIIIK
jgi:hypothetical protein